MNRECLGHFVFKCRVPDNCRTRVPDKESQQHQALQGFQPNRTTGDSKYGISNKSVRLVMECDGGDGVLKLSIGITTPIKNVLFTPP